jgi:endonuclease/exonuclease/phosphatase family metal-dependent hydrolase
MRIATYNIEWMDRLFDNDGALLNDDGWSSRHKVTRKEQTDALGVVFKAMDADAVMVIEAPDQGKRRDAALALETFAARFGLRARKAAIGFANDTQQEIAMLYDPDAMTVRHDPKGDDLGETGGRNAPRFDGAFRIDLDVDDVEDLVTFSKPPLELAIKTKAGFDLHLIGAHLKSKAAHGARNRDEVMRFSIANRRKQLAQAIWLRQRITDHLDQGTPLIVMGDMNDGPGLDEYEHLFGRSSVEVLLGDKGMPKLIEPHAQIALSRRLAATPTTSRFFVKHHNRFLQALLDYIMVSPDLEKRNASWRIWHPLDDPKCWDTPKLRDALVTASDHFPVTLDIDV